MPHLLGGILLLSALVSSQKNPSDIGIRGQEEISFGQIICDDVEECSRESYSICGSDGKTYPSRCQFTMAYCKEKNFNFAHFGPCTLSEKCRGDRQAALENAKRNKGVFIPKCRPDGGYAAVQCHNDTGYCWCSAPSGNPLSQAKRNEEPDCPLDLGTPNRDNNGKPPSERQQGSTTNSSLTSPGILQECSPCYKPDQNTGDPVRSGESMENGTNRSAFPPLSGRKPKHPRCHGKRRNKFNKNVREHFKVEFTLENKAKIEAKDIRMPTVLRWKFNQLDKRKDAKLRRSEFRDLQRLIRRHVKPRKCSKVFPLMCDLNRDKKISLKEWTSCFAVGKSHKIKQMNNFHTDFRSENDVQIGMGPVSRQPEPCRREINQAVEPSLGGTSLYIPECDENGFYKPVQCYGSPDKKRWYCFCVDVQYGTMIESTSIRNGTPNCPLTSRKKPWPGCPAPDPEAKFLTSLTAYLLKFAQTINRKMKILPGSTTVEIALQKIFVQLDRNRNNYIDKKERRNLRKLIKKDRRLWQCGRNIHKVCDINEDHKITLQEFTVCIMPRKEVSKSKPSQDFIKGSKGGKNPFIEVIKSE